jgi:hypothetical protein
MGEHLASIGISLWCPLWGESQRWPSPRLLALGHENNSLFLKALIRVLEGLLVDSFKI